LELPRNSRSSLFAVPFLVTNFFDFLTERFYGTGIEMARSVSGPL
jgi:hypothetical protein